MTWAPNRSASCPAISRRAAFDRSRAMLTITVAYVIDLSCVAIHRSLLRSKPGKTTEIDQVSDPFCRRNHPSNHGEGVEVPATAGKSGFSRLEQELPFGSLLIISKSPWL